MRVDRVDTTVELVREQVVQDQAADRLASSRRADHGYGPGLKHPADGFDGSDPVSIFKAGLRRGRERGRHLHVKPIGSGSDLNRESALTEDLDHPIVGDHDFGGERRDPVLLGDLGQMRQ